MKRFSELAGTWDSDEKECEARKAFAIRSLFWCAPKLHITQFPKTILKRWVFLDGGRENMTKM